MAVNVSGDMPPPGSNSGGSETNHSRYGTPAVQKGKPFKSRKDSRQYMLSPQYVAAETAESLPGPSRLAQPARENKHPADVRLVDRRCARAAGAEDMLTGMGTSTPEAVTVQYRQSAGEDAGRIQYWDPTPAPARPS